MDISTLPTLKFAIVEGPRFPKLSQFKDSLTGLSFFLAFGGFLGLTYLGFGDYISYVWETGQIPVQSSMAKVYLALVLITFFFFGYAIFSVLKARFKPITKRYPDIGYFYLGPDKIRMEWLDGSEAWESLISDIPRIDCYYGMGVATQTRKSSVAFHDIMVINMLISLRGEQKSLYIQTNEFGINETGMLCKSLEVIKKSNLQHHRRIQFWDRYH